MALISAVAGKWTKGEPWYNWGIQQQNSLWETRKIRETKENSYKNSTKINKSLKEPTTMNQTTRNQPLQINRHHEPATATKSPQTNYLANLNCQGNLNPCTKPAGRNCNSSNKPNPQTHHKHNQHHQTEMIGYDNYSVTRQEGKL